MAMIRGVDDADAGLRNVTPVSANCTMQVAALRCLMNNALCQKDGGLPTDTKSSSSINLGVRALCPSQPQFYQIILRFVGKEFSEKIPAKSMMLWKLLVCTIDTMIEGNVIKKK